MVEENRGEAGGQLELSVVDTHQAGTHLYLPPLRKKYFPFLVVWLGMFQRSMGSFVCLLSGLEFKNASQ